MQFVSLVETRLIRLLIHEHDGETRVITFSGMAEYRTSPLWCRKKVLPVVSFRGWSKRLHCGGFNRRKSSDALVCYAVDDADVVATSA